MSVSFDPLELAFLAKLQNNLQSGRSIITGSDIKAFLGKSQDRFAALVALFVSEGCLEAIAPPVPRFQGPYIKGSIAEAGLIAWHNRWSRPGAGRWRILGAVVKLARDRHDGRDRPLSAGLQNLEVLLEQAKYEVGGFEHMNDGQQYSALKKRNGSKLLPPSLGAFKRQLSRLRSRTGTKKNMPRRCRQANGHSIVSAEQIDTRED